MNTGTIGVRYARALLKFALEHGEEQIVYKEMETMVNIYMTAPNLRQIIENPALSSEQIENVLILAAGTQTSDTTRHFIRFIVTKHRANIMQFIAGSFISLYLKHKRITKSRLIVPSEIMQAQIDRFRLMIEKRVGSNVELTIETDPSIGGGFILEYGTYRIDASINNQLNKIKQNLLVSSKVC